jgi:hypothetical protein
MLFGRPRAQDIEPRALAGARFLQWCFLLWKLYEKRVILDTVENVDFIEFKL